MKNNNCLKIIFPLLIFFNYKTAQAKDHISISASFGVNRIFEGINERQINYKVFYKNQFGITAGLPLIVPFSRHIGILSGIHLDYMRRQRIFDFNDADNLINQKIKLNLVAVQVPVQLYFKIRKKVIFGIGFTLNHDLGVGFNSKLKYQSKDSIAYESIFGLKPSNNIYVTFSSRLGYLINKKSSVFMEINTTQFPNIQAEKYDVNNSGNFIPSYARYDNINWNSPACLHISYQYLLWQKKGKTPILKEIEP